MIFKKKNQQQTKLQKAQLEFSRDLFVLHAKFLAECQRPGANKVKLLKVYDGRWRSKCITAKHLRKIEISPDAFIRIAKNDKINQEMVEKLSSPVEVILPIIKKPTLLDKVKKYLRRSFGRKA